jgi:hypothetical protein
MNSMTSDFGAIKICEASSIYDANKVMYAKAVEKYDAFEELNKCVNGNVPNEFRKIKDRLCSEGIYDGVICDLFEYYESKNPNCDSFTNLLFACSHFTKKELDNELREEKNEIEQQIKSSFIHDKK